MINEDQLHDAARDFAKDPRFYIDDTILARDIVTFKAGYALREAQVKEGAPEFDEGRIKAMQYRLVEEGWDIMDVPLKCAISVHERMQSAIAARDLEIESLKQKIEDLETWNKYRLDGLR